MESNHHTSCAISSSKQCLSAVAIVSNNDKNLKASFTLWCSRQYTAINRHKNMRKFWMTLTVTLSKPIFDYEVGHSLTTCCSGSGTRTHVYGLWDRSGNHLQLSRFLAMLMGVEPNISRMSSVHYSVYAKNSISVHRFPTLSKRPFLQWSMTYHPTGKQCVRRLTRRP